jgi:hypothetical protein
VSLGYLIKHWGFHFPNDTVPTAVRQAISSTPIQYEAGKKQRVDMLSLASKELKSIAPKGVPFLDLLAVENERWLNLNQFGVRVAEHYHFVRQCI